MVSFDLTDRVAIVTGSSQGIGRAIALALAEAGADVVVVARRPEPISGRGRTRRHEPVEPVVEAVRQMERRSLGITADLRQREPVDLMVRQVMGTLGRIDILVNNAGGTFGETFRPGPLLEITEQDLAETLRTNLWTLFLCSRAVAPIMKAQGKGVIINMASGTGRSPAPGLGAYSAVKAAVINLTQTMAQEWAPEVRVNALAPGVVDTPHVPPGDPEPEVRQPATGISLGRMATPQEMAGAVVYLASDAASYATGTILEVHGGARGR
jgi:NAD(P)-dependent dehydrogenase (short-subunit alcohol dehydrogenase family)